MSDSSQPVVAIPAELLPYVAVAELIVQTFGQDCEVVLHDLRTPEKSVCYVANGHVTGRKVGESFNHLISQALVAADSAEGVIPNYYFRHPALLRSLSARQMARFWEPFVSTSIPPKSPSRFSF